MKGPRVVTEPSPAVAAFAAIRLLVAVCGLVAIALAGFPYGEGLTIVVAALAIPWAAGILALAQRAPGRALSPLVALGDFAVLAAIEASAPETYGAVRFVALFLVAAHAHLHGTPQGPLIGGAAAAVLVPVAVVTDVPVGDDLLPFYEVLFAVSTLATGIVVGGLKEAQIAEQARARDLSRRAMESENEVRRRVAESIHDGPVQELVALDMTLTAASRAAGGGNQAGAAELIESAREVASRNVAVLRDEILTLGPLAFEDLTFVTAVERCAPVWRSRHGIDVVLDTEPVDLSSEICDGLFRIAQEAVTNAGRHSGASTVAVSLRRVDGTVELRVKDDGKGFGDVSPLGPGEPGHIGLASMRQRAELLGGELEIRSAHDGTELLVRLRA